MSYEGYEQVLCKNGHYFTYDCYEFIDLKKWTCPMCEEPCVWANLVDITNGSWETDIDDNLIIEDGCLKRIDGYIELEVIDELVCSCCGSVLERRYEIPEKGYYHLTKENGDE